MHKQELHFVISAPRSGSTWLMKALNQHPSIFATEHRLFGNFCEMWPNNNGKMAPRITLDAYVRALSVHYEHSEIAESRSAFGDDFLQSYLEFVVGYAQKKTGCSVVVDKITPYPGTAHFVVEQIRKFVPQAKIYKLVRDGRDVLTSGTFDWLLKDDVDSERHNYFIHRRPGQNLRRFFDDDVIEKWARIWRESLLCLKNVDITETIRYESMISDLPEVLSRVFNSLRLELNNSMVKSAADNVSFVRTTGRENGNMQATAKQRNGIVGDWRKYTTRKDAELFDRIAGSQLIDEGYESDNRWINDLPDELSLSPQHESDGAIEN